jgi:hypothetical protein
MVVSPTIEFIIKIAGKPAVFFKKRYNRYNYQVITQVII